MHNEFYASGFLYHPASEQILLQQDPETETPQWSLFSVQNEQPDTSPQHVFHRMISRELGLKITREACLPVYDYLHKKFQVPHFIFYVEVDEAYDEEALLTEHKTSWFYFRQIIKLPMHKQTRQDITVGQRVINLALRETLQST